MRAGKKILFILSILCLLLCFCLFFTACNSDNGLNASNVPVTEDGNAVGNGSPKPITVDVTDFGADPSGVSDCAEAIRAAVAKAKEYAVNGRQVTVSFLKGRYDIYPDKAAERTLYISNTTGADLRYRNKRIGILLEDMDNVTVDGNGSLFMFHGKMTEFACINCNNATFKNFEVDFQVPTVIDVTVEALIGEDTAIVSIPDRYNYSVSGKNVRFFSDSSPYTGETYWEFFADCADYTQRYDRNADITYRGDVKDTAVFSDVSSIEDIGGNRLKITYSHRSDEIAPDMSFQMRPTVRDHAGAFLWKSKDVRLENLDIRFMHGFGIVGQHSENITLNGVDFETDGDRSSAGYADFVQMSGCKGKIDIGNCTFINPHDDPINVHGTYLQVESIYQNQVIVRYKHRETAGFPNFFVGDKIEFVNSRTLSVVKNSERTVVAVDGPDGTGGDMGTSTQLRTIVLTLDEAPPLSVRAVGAFCVENITWSPDVHIHDCIFRRSPTRGILATTRGDIIIENNLFDGIDMAGIYVSDDADNWFESGHVENLTIKNNVFMKVGAQAILIEPTNSRVSRTSPVHYNINIEGNTFYNGDSYILEAKSVKGLRFADNVIYIHNSSESGYLNGHISSEDDGIEASSDTGGLSRFRLRACSEVVIENNVYRDGLNAVIEYSDMYASDITVANDRATAVEIAPDRVVFDMINLSWIIPIALSAIAAAVLIAVRTIRRKRIPKSHEISSET